MSGVIVRSVLPFVLSHPCLPIALYAVSILCPHQFPRCLTHERTVQAVVDVVMASTPLPEDGRFTIFAPTDDAFAAAAKAFGGALPDDESVIASVCTSPSTDLLPRIRT